MKEHFHRKEIEKLNKMPSKYHQNWSSTAASAKYITDEMLAPFVSNAMPTSQVELTISCRNLINTDVLSKSDPYCVVSMREPWQEQYFDIARTEVVKDSLNPQWVKKLVLNYNFESIQKIKFEVRDEDDGSYDYLGRFETTLGELVSASGHEFVGKLKGVSTGDIVVVTEEVSGCKQSVEIQFHAEKLTRLAWFCSNDPFLVISRSNEDGSYSVVTKSETVYSTQHPTWKPFNIRATSLCNGDFDRTIKIDCYDHRSNGNHKLIGSCYSNLRNLSTTETSMNLVNEEKKKHNSSHKTDGILKVVRMRIIENISFLDYIRNGTQMHFAVAIDFTASNGTHTDPRSLHFLSPDRMNNYEVALRAVGDIIQHYDHAQLFPAFGKI